MKKEAEEPRSKNKAIIDLKTPYNLKESFLWIFRRILSRLDRDNDANIKYIPKRLVINENIKKELTIIFSGDWNDLLGKNIKLGKKLKSFIRKSDYFVLNLEKLISEENWKEDRLHKPNIMENIANLFTPKHTVLSLANNHASDYGDEKLNDTISMIEEQGFIVIGVRNKPFFDLYNDFRIVAATRWSNYLNDNIVSIDSAQSLPKENSYNVLFPHWGYEFELFPRGEDVELARKYVEQFDVIVGHHSHCPQPVNIEYFQDMEKLVAYSLGTFCANRNALSYKYGILLKVHFGKDPLNKWKITKIKWATTKCSSFARKRCKVEIIKRPPFFNRKSSVFPS